MGMELDIKFAEKLIIDNGLICGDDLELEVAKIDVKYAKKNLDKDYIKDPKINHFFHPGATLSVAMHFDKVGNYCGFWIVQKNESGFTAVELDKSETIISKYLKTKKEYILKELNKCKNIVSYGKCFE